MLEKIRDLSNSGANIDINKKGKEIFVVKRVSMSNKEVKSRILIQINKQNEWSKKKLIKPFYSVPIKYRILKNEIIMNMPFIHGYSGSDILNFNSIEHSNMLAKKLIKLIYFFKNIKNNSTINKKEINKKINYVNKKSVKYFNKYFFKIKQKLNSVPNDLETTYCHGDLTLSNMIITNNLETKSGNFYNKNIEIHLIDWLDNNFENYYLDLAKLKQDLFYGWSSRNLSENEKITNDITGKYIWKKIENEFIDKNNIKIFNFFMNLCILRIIPYAKSKNDILWIKKTLDTEK